MQDYLALGNMVDSILSPYWCRSIIPNSNSLIKCAGEGMHISARGSHYFCRSERNRSRTLHQKCFLKQENDSLIPTMCTNKMNYHATLGGLCLNCFHQIVLKFFRSLEICWPQSNEKRLESILNNSTVHQYYCMGRVKW